MSDQSSTVTRRTGGEFSKEELSAWIAETLKANAKKTISGIAMSNAVFAKLGKPDNYDGIKVVADPKLYPDDTIEIRFE